MRQRLSSEPDRYRGRRRVPTPPRSRYAVAVTAAFAGAGVVALGAANLPDQKQIDPQALTAQGSVQSVDEAIAERDAGTDAASRSNNRGAAQTQVSAEQAEADAWLLPLEDYDFTSAFGVRWNKLHAGIDLAAPEGVPFKAVHGGEVTQAGYYGAYGYSVTIKDDEGREFIYAHARRVLVKKGDVVKAGQVLGQVGNTGASYGTHLHLEVHVDGSPTDPIPLLRQHGVDIKLQVESVYANMAAAS
ncbi:M23 family metallopeptidase [Actinoplanes sp. LDG1-06]|uniref:M23 family metallopeptidase n=1 Tax=Paractinoplanes ovalisporus TaxID=2810368 RepID=A0ABS2AJ68_9ACTN|nr:M23 family metallopeptidase [Actinoplanes ovalisporus]MBM2619266.1 M23 family metallopeptidase [Actinoplanes ovalisporus]